MLPVDPQNALARLLELQRAIRDAVAIAHTSRNLYHVNRSSAADTIYQIDAGIEPLLTALCDEWSRTVPLVLVAEGLQEDGRDVASRVFPRGTSEAEALLRVLVDPIDGTRGLMYDKRSAWALAGVASNKGPATRLRDIEVAAMTELPTRKMAQADVLWALKGRGAAGQRVDLRTGEARPLELAPSKATTIAHGFASVANFFPATKELASAALETIARELLGPADVSKAMVFDDQYICTGGQFYELIVGHDRFVADLRPLLYRIQGLPEGMCCHPYDCAAWLIAEEAGVILTNALGEPLDGPLDVTTGLSWAGYANAELRRQIEPVLKRFLKERGLG